MYVCISRREIIKSSGVAIVGLLTISKGMAQSTPSPQIAQSEAKEINAFAESYSKYLKAHEELKANKAASREIAQFEQSAKDVITAIPSTKRNLQSLIKKQRLPAYGRMLTRSLRLMCKNPILKQSEKSNLLGWYAKVAGPSA
jgi:hypothetical protein